MSKWPNIEAIASGTIAGEFRDWPRVRPEAKALLATVDEQAREIERLTEQAGQYRRSLRTLENVVCAFPGHPDFTGKRRAIEGGVPILEPNVVVVGEIVAREKQLRAALDARYHCLNAIERDLGWFHPEESVTEAAVAIVRKHRAALAASAPEQPAPAAPSAEPEGE